MKNAKKYLSVFLVAVMLTVFGAQQVQAAQQTAKASAIQDVFSSFFRNLMKGKDKKEKKSDLIVILDPGHGGFDYGAIANGLQEKIITQKIAVYCKAELEKYKGVKVFLTRLDDSYVSLEERIKSASAYGADVFVSLHINSDATKEAHGAEVYYPNSNYKPGVGQQGRKLAGAIQNNLAALGLNDRGVKTLNSMSGETYPDGSQADYYAVIRGAKQAGYPGIIVEHAFVSNEFEAKEFLSRDTALKKLGIADAKGIASCYGLKKSGEDAGTLTKTNLIRLTGKSSNRAQLKWEEVKAASGYEVYRSVSKKDGYKKVGETKGSRSTSFTDKTVKSGKSYYYKVRPYKISGKKKTTAGFCTAQNVRLLKMPGISVKAQSGRFQISWKKVKGASRYEVYRSASKKGRYVKVASVEQGTFFQDINCKPQKTYYYKVRAAGNGIGGNNLSSYSEIKWSTLK